MKPAIRYERFDPEAYWHTGRYIISRDCFDPPDVACFGPDERILTARNLDELRAKFDERLLSLRSG